MRFFLKDTRCKLTKGIINSCNIRVNKKWIYSAYFDFHGENKIGNWCNFLSVKERANKKKLKVFVAYLGQIFRNNNFILHPHIFYKSYFLRLRNQTGYSLWYSFRTFSVQKSTLKSIIYFYITQSLIFVQYTHPNL